MAGKDRPARGGKELDATTLTESKFLSRHKDRYDHPSVPSSEGYQDDAGSGGKWRYMTDWAVYRRWGGGGRDDPSNSSGSSRGAASHGVNSKLSRLNYFPENDVFTNEYVVRGRLVDRDNNVSNFRLQLDRASCDVICMDRSKTARGWWVCSRNGDYYRLLDPAPDRRCVLTRDDGVTVSTAYLSRRAILALVSNILDLVLYHPDETSRAAKLTVQDALAAYVQQMRDDYDVDVLPILGLYNYDVYRNLVGAHPALNDKCQFFITLSQLEAPSHPVLERELLRITVAAEALSRQAPWGLALPSTNEVSETETTTSTSLLDSTPSLSETSCSRDSSESDSDGPIPSHDEADVDPDPTPTMAELQSQYGPTYFDYPQSGAGYDIECCLEVPWRTIDQWRAYQIGPTDRHPSESAVVELPNDGNMRDYVLEGVLVAPNGVRAKVRLVNLTVLSFDRSKEARGWWISEHDGDGQTEIAFYRFLQPDTRHLPEGGLYRDAFHLRRRVLLALLTNILEICFPDAERARVSARQPVDLALRDYVARLADAGILLEPVLSMFKHEIQGNLLHAFEELTPGCCFIKTLRKLPSTNPPSATTMLALAKVAEEISGQPPWGSPLPVESLAETTTPEAVSKRARQIDAEDAGLAKKQRTNSCPPLDKLRASPLGMVVTRETKSALLSLEEFKVLLKMIENDTGTSISEHEKSNGVRMVGRCKALQYGRILPDAMEKVFDATQLTRYDTFVDLGSGIGTLVLQAAYTRGCVSKGIEIVEGRHDVAKQYEGSALRCLKRFSGVEPGLVKFKRGDLKTLSCAKYIETNVRSYQYGRLVAFCNNYDGLMGVRSEHKSGASVEQYIAGLFASWPAGSVLVTVSPLLCLGIPSDVATSELKKHRMNLEEPSWASFYDVDEIILGPQNEVAAWSSDGGCTNPFVAYKYTRLAQEGYEKAVFRCLNPSCPTAQSGQAIDAVNWDDEGMPTLNTCSCGYQQRVLRSSPPNRGNDGRESEGGLDI